MKTDEHRTPTTEPPVLKWLQPEDARGFGDGSVRSPGAYSCMPALADSVAICCRQQIDPCLSREAMPLCSNTENRDLQLLLQSSSQEVLELKLHIALLPSMPSDAKR